MKNELTHLDLFSGIGGFALAAQRAGFRTICFSEVEPSACEWLQGNFPGVPNLGDIRKPNAFHGIRGVTVLTGGFPCQPFSNSGRKLGKNDPRHLWPAMLGVIKISKPAWVLGENVVGIIDMEIDNCIADLENIGYEVQPLIIPACAVGGMHKRDRVWICAHAKRPRLQGREQDSGVSGGSRTTHAKPRNRVSASWDELERHCRSLRKSDGVSCQMVRNQIHAYGNAIVPQVAEVILKEIYNQIIYGTTS